MSKGKECKVKECGIDNKIFWRYQGANYKIVAIKPHSIKKDDVRKICLRCGEKNIWISKERLIEVSGFFNEMLNILGETDESIILDTEHELYVLENVSKGNDRIALTEMNAIEHLEIAYKYDMAGWIRECVDYIECRLDTVLDILFQREKKVDQLRRFKKNYWTKIPERMRQFIICEETRMIMGRKFIGVAEWEKLFGVGAINESEVPILPDNMASILTSPCPLFSKAKKQVCDTHILFLVPKKLKGQDLTMMEWDRLLSANVPNSPHRATFNTYFKKSFKSKEFANYSVKKARWVLMPKEILLGTIAKSFEDQKRYLNDYQATHPRAKAYKVLRTIEISTGIFLYYLMTGDRLHGDNYRIRINDTLWPSYANTFDTTSHALPVYVGAFCSLGLQVYNYNYPSGPIGLSIGVLSEPGKIFAL